MSVYIWGSIMAATLAALAYFILRDILKPVSSEKRRYLENSRKAGRTLDEFSIRELRDNMLEKIKEWKDIPISEDFREEMNKNLNRLGIDKTAEDIRRMQVLYTSIYIGASLLTLLFSVFVGILMLFLSYYIWNLPVNSIRNEIKTRNTEFLIRLDELYSVIYNQYKRKNDEHLGKIIAAYIPTTSDLMRKELMLVMRDIESGEDYALKQLKQRIPNPTILRFCDIILNNLEGVDNVDVMENFYMELKQVRDRRRRKRNEKRAKRIDLVNNSLYAPFIVLVVIYLIVSTISNF